MACHCEQKTCFSRDVFSLYCCVTLNRKIVVLFVCGGARRQKLAKNRLIALSCRIFQSFGVLNINVIGHILTACATWFCGQKSKRSAVVAGEPSTRLVSG